MINRVIGEIVELNKDSLVLLNANIGLKIYTNNEVLSKAKLKEKIELYTFLSVKENALDLYGFLKKDEQSFFELLISISGIGPKGALGILNQANPQELKESIQSSDYSILTSVSGIGKKTAERIVLELKNKIGKIEMTEINIDRHGDKVNIDFEAMEALKSLGYTGEEAREALKQIKEQDLNDISEKVKAALKLLGKA